MSEAEKAAETEEVTEQHTQTAGKTYSQAEVDAIMEKVRATEGKKVAAVKDEFNAFKAERQTEEEKAEEARKAALQKELETAKANAKKEARLIGALMGKGLKETQAENLARAAGTEWDNTEEALSTLQESFGVSFDNKSRVGGGGGDAPGSAKTTEWTPENVEKALDGLSPDERAAWWAKHEKEILEYQNRHSTIRSYAPGEFKLGA